MEDEPEGISLTRGISLMSIAKLGKQIIVGQVNRIAHSYDDSSWHDQYIGLTPETSRPTSISIYYYHSTRRLLSSMHLKELSS